MSQGTWHRIAAQLGWPVDASVNALRDAPPDTQRIALELARTYQKLLRPFEEVWTKSLLRQQQTLLENHRASQQQQQQQQSGQAGSAATTTPLLPQQAPIQRPPSQNAQTGGGPHGSPQLEASRQQLLSQAKAASASTQQVQASPALAAAAKAQLPTPGPSKLNTEPSMEQLAEAKNMVSLIRQQIEATRRELDDPLPSSCAACLLFLTFCPRNRSTSQGPRDPTRSASPRRADHARAHPGGQASRRNLAAVPGGDGGSRSGPENVDLCASFLASALELGSRSDRLP